MTNLGLKLINHPIVKLLFKTPWIGIYPSFAAALAAIPPESQIGYNQDRTQEVFSTYPVDRVRPADYPILLHLKNLMRPKGRLVDLGGNIGMACYTAQKYYALPADFEWVLCDVPKVIETAKAVAVREGERSHCLRFVTDLRDTGHCDIFFSSGALQFIEAPLPELLAQLPALPESVLINRIPVWDREAIASLHDIGFCIAPYHVFNRNAFTTSMEKAGYRLVDTWKCPESTLSIRFRPYIRINAYEGFYFERIR
jgi:putative methyltransferase (TIGR04325 family)